MKIKLRDKEVFGRTLFYPDCIISKMICFVFDRKCLHAKHIEKIEKLGWEIVYESKS